MRIQSLFENISKNTKAQTIYEYSSGFWWCWWCGIVGDGGWWCLWCSVVVVVGGVGGVGDARGVVVLVVLAIVLVPVQVAFVGLVMVAFAVTRAG